VDSWTTRGQVMQSLWLDLTGLGVTLPMSLRVYVLRPALLARSTLELSRKSVQPGSGSGSMTSASTIGGAGLGGV